MKKFTVIFLTIIILLCAFSLFACKKEPVEQHIHVVQEYAAKEATCTQEGNTKYWKCLKCEKYFADSACKTEIKSADVVISAKGHTEEIVPAVDPTCGETGLTEGKKCSVCGEFLQEQQQIDSLGHHFENGKCTRCGIKDPFFVDVSVGLEMTPQGDGQSYVVSGIGSCTDLDVVVPSQYNGLPVTAVSDNAFAGNANITSVTVSYGVTNIGVSAFARCAALQKVIFADSVAKISAYAFEECTSLTDVTLGYGVKTIGDRAFYGCESLTKLSVPDSIANVGKNVFDRCSSAFEYTSWGNCKYLGNENNKYLVLVTANIKDQAAVGINPNTKVIAGMAFFGCSNLNFVQLHDGIIGVGVDAFSGCKLATANTYGGALYLGVDGNDYFLLVRAENNAITSCDINPQTVIVSDQAFYNCANLTEITIPDSVVTVGSLAFYGCGNLKKITIGGGVKDLGDRAFGSCQNLESISVADSNQNYRSETNCLIARSSNTVVLGCKNGTIPQGVVGIGERAFDGYSALQQVTIPSSVKFIGKHAFEGCNNLTNVTIGSGLVGLDVSAFQNCSKLQNVVIPSGVTYIGESAFAFSGLESINIPDSVSGIGRSAFYFCTAMKEVRLAQGLETIGQSAFGYCLSLTNITIPNSVKTIDNNAFSYCSALEEVQIGSGVVSIGSGAFRGCAALSQLTIPQSVTYIGETVFSGCTALNSVTFENTADWVVSNAEKFAEVYHLDSAKLAEQQTAASYLADKYCKFYWVRG